MDSEMELDSQIFTPPSSPIIGYSGDDDEQTKIDSGVVYCLNCKGALRPHDHSFSPESYLLRREAISAIENLRSDHVKTYRISGKPRLLRCFGYQFDPLDKEQIKKMILILRKNVSSLEILSESSHSYNNYDMTSVTDDSQDLFNKSPWNLRKNACQFLNVIVRGLRYYRTAWKVDELEGMFTGLKKTLPPVKDWSSVLKSHCGYRSGNDCSSATYHFFHMQLELRWSLFLIFGASHSMANWLMDELLQLAKFKFISEDTTPLDERQPFNCTCVKEIWTLIKIVIEHMQPELRQEKPFWRLFEEAVQRSNSGSDPFFSIWITSHMAQISDYGIAGVHRAGQGRVDSKENENNALQWIHNEYKEWMIRGGKSEEILRLSINFLQYWGGDNEIIGALWTQWVPRVDRGIPDLSSMERYSSVEKWLTLITHICESSAEICGSLEKEKNKENVNITPVRPSFRPSSKTRPLGTHNDPFMEFVTLVAAYSRWASEKDIRRLQSNICTKLNRNNCRTTEFSEIGIMRVSSLFMALSMVIEFEKLVVSMIDRLKDVFEFGKGKNTPGRRKVILRAYSCAILILLKKKISLAGGLSIVSLYMKSVDELLCQNSSDPHRKDLAMIYIDLLDSLPKHTPSLCNRTDLGRHLLFSSNLSMWFTNAGNNYVLRTARCLSQVTEWIIKWVMESIMLDFTSSSEGKDIFVKIGDKSLPFMKSVVTLNSNRIPSTDVEPLACLAADVTLLTRKFRQSANEYEKDFDLFAMNERTCPLVSQYFVQRLFKNKEFIEHSFPLVKWTQTWIRLVTLDCSVPDELTEIVLDNGFSSTSNETLLREYCQKLRRGACDQMEVQNYMYPLVQLLKGVMNGSLFKDDQRERESISVIKSVIASCAIVLKEVKFELLYVKGMTSVAHNFLDLMVPPPWPSTPPWEKFSETVLRSLEKCLYVVFEAVALYPYSAQDQYLLRKLREIVIFAFFGFIKSPPESADRDCHPAFKIMDLSEDKEINQVLSDIVPNHIAGDHVVGDTKLTQLFLSSVQMFRAKNIAATLVRVLSGVIRAYLNHSNCRQSITNCCVNAVVYCCLVGSITNSKYNRLVLEGFQKAFEKEFMSKGRHILNLCNTVVKSKNCTNGALDARWFIKSEVIPLLKEWVEKCEHKRGIGRDQSLRQPLEMLELETANVPF